VSSRAFLVVCEDCPPYDPIRASNVVSQARRSTRRRGRAPVEAVNQATPFTDNMWCRRGEQITAQGVVSRGLRTNGR